MTEPLRDKLIRCGWVTNFNADTLVQLIERHFAALAQPEPVGLTNTQIDKLAAEYLDGDRASVRDFARAVLARWGRPAIEPIPVSERLPTEADCDADGRCWIGSSPEDEADNFNSSWELSSFTHGDTCWLPFHALPIPHREEKYDG